LVVAAPAHLEIVVASIEKPLPFLAALVSILKTWVSAPQTV